MTAEIETVSLFPNPDSWSIEETEEGRYYTKQINVSGIGLITFSVSCEPIELKAWSPYCWSFGTDDFSIYSYGYGHTLEEAIEDMVSEYYKETD